MPTKKPRVNVTLEPEVYQALKEFQQATNSSISSFIASIVQEALPAIRGLTKAAKLAHKNNLEAFDLLQQQMLEATQKASQISLDIHETKKALHRTAGPKNDDNG